MHGLCVARRREIGEEHRRRTEVGADEVGGRNGGVRKSGAYRLDLSGKLCRNPGGKHGELVRFDVYGHHLTSRAPAVPAHLFRYRSPGSLPLFPHRRRVARTLTAGSAVVPGRMTTGSTRPSPGPFPGPSCHDASVVGITASRRLAGAWPAMGAAMLHRYSTYDVCWWQVLAPAARRIPQAQQFRPRITPGPARGPFGRQVHVYLVGSRQLWQQLSRAVGK